MLEEHLKEVQDLLLEKKNEFEEMNDLSSRTDEQIPANAPLRSPPALGRAFTPAARQESVGAALKSPKMPAMGYFNVSSPAPKSPRSPLKRGGH
jgi:histone deacetylase 6